jgi:hypothetical protein
VVHQGEKVVLRWSAPNGQQVTLEQAIDPMEDIRVKFDLIGTFPATGTMDVYPQKSVTYVVSCGNKLIGRSSPLCTSSSNDGF